MIVFSHARSGSTQFLKILERALNKNLNGSVIFSLEEFFNPLSYSTFGNVLGEMYKVTCLGKKTFNVETFKLGIAADQIPVLLQSIKPKDLLQHILIKEDLEFDSSEQMNLFLKKELNSRFTFYQELVDLNYIPLVKQFIDLPVFDKTPNTEFLNFYKGFQDRLTEFENIVFYRKNFYEAILSNFIKVYYYDIPGIEQKFETEMSNYAHNYGKMQPLIPQKKIVEDQIFDIAIDYFKSFLNFYHRHRFDKVVAYEEMFSNNQIFINYKNNKILLERYSNNKEEEIPMNYQVPRKDYFDNSEQLLKRIEDSFDDRNLRQGIDELKIFFS
jgi:hypothetical protein